MGANRVGKLLALRNRLAANLACGVNVVLRLNCIDDVDGGDAQFGEFVRLDPHAQSILATKGLYARHALHARDLVLKVNDRVVGEEVLAQFAAG